MRPFHLPFFVLSLSLLAAGCGGNGAPPQPKNSDEHEDSHHGDELYWQTGNLEHEDVTISLGHHGTHVYTSHTVEPAVMIVRDGDAVGDANVFVTMLSADGEAIGEEQSTEFEPKTPDEPAHYAKAKFKVPGKTDSITFRYRIEFAGDVLEFTKDVLINVETHD